MKNIKYFLLIFTVLLFVSACSLEKPNEIIEDVITQTINVEEEVVEDNIENNTDKDIETIEGELVEKTEIVIEKEIIKTENPDYRNVKWGMTREDVLDREDSLLLIDFKEVLEGQDIVEDDEILLYETFLKERKFDLIYYFNENKLYGSILKYKDIEEDYLLVFNEILDHLNQEYLTDFKLEDCYHWKNEKESEENTIDLVKNGHLILYKSWQDKKTETILSLFKKEDGLLLSIYSSEINE